jgi:hypothetical protein
MKKILLLLILLLLFLTPVIADTDLENQRKNAIAIDPVWLIFNTYKGSYERLIFDQFSLQVEAAYSPDFFWGLHEYNSLTYLDITGEARYYFGHFLKDAAAEVDLGEYSKHLSRIFTDGIGGLYIGVFGGYVNSVLEDGKDASYFKGTFNGFGGGIELGCKYIFGDGKISFFLEPYGILQLYTGSYTYKDSTGSTIARPINFENDGFDRNGASGGLNFGLIF